MIRALKPGMRLRLPSGNVVHLVRRERTEWLCEFADGSSRRGEVVFCGSWLRKVGTVC